MALREPAPCYRYLNTAASFIVGRSGIELRHLAAIDDIMWSSDYPHHGNDWQYSRKVIDETMGIPADDRIKFVGGNAARIWGVE